MPRPNDAQLSLHTGAHRRHRDVSQRQLTDRSMSCTGPGPRQSHRPSQDVPLAEWQVCKPKQERRRTRVSLPTVRSYQHRFPREADRLYLCAFTSTQELGEMVSPILSLVGRTAAIEGSGIVSGCPTMAERRLSTPINVRRGLILLKRHESTVRDMTDVAPQYSSTCWRSARHAASSAVASASRSAGVAAGSSTQRRKSSPPLITSMASRPCSYS